MAERHQGLRRVHEEIDLSPFIALQFLAFLLFSKLQ